MSTNFIISDLLKINFHFQISDILANDVYPCRWMLDFRSNVSPTILKVELEDGSSRFLRNGATTKNIIIYILCKISNHVYVYYVCNTGICKQLI